MTVDRIPVEDLVPKRADSGKVGVERERKIGEDGIDRRNRDDLPERREGSCIRIVAQSAEGVGTVPSRRLRRVDGGRGHADRSGPQDAGAMKQDSIHQGS